MRDDYYDTVKYQLVLHARNTAWARKTPAHRSVSNAVDGNAVPYVMTNVHPRRPTPRIYRPRIPRPPGFHVVMFVSGR